MNVPPFHPPPCSELGCAPLSARLMMLLMTQHAYVCVHNMPAAAANQARACERVDVCVCARTIQGVRADTVCRP